MNAFLKGQDYDSLANEQFGLFKGKCHVDSSRTPFIAMYEILHVQRHYGFLAMVRTWNLLTLESRRHRGVDPKASWNAVLSFLWHFDELI